MLHRLLKMHHNKDKSEYIIISDIWHNVLRNCVLLVLKNFIWNITKCVVKLCI